MKHTRQRFSRLRPADERPKTRLRRHRMEERLSVHGLLMKQRPSRSPPQAIPP